MRPVEELILQSRRATENEVSSTTEGILDIEFIYYFNDAQERLQSRILEHNAVAFNAETLMDTVANQAEYSLPQDTYLNNRIVNIEYSRTGLTQDFYRLRRKTIAEKNNITSASLDAYIPSSGKIIIDPMPSESRPDSLKITYAHQVNRLDVKRFEVAAVVLDTGTSTITSMTLNNLNSTIPLGDDDYNQMVTDSFFTITDGIGAVKMRNIRFDSIDPTTGIVTVNSGFTFETGETAAVGDIVCAGKNATNRSELPDETERYLLAYANWKILKRDSSTDSQEALEEMLRLEEDILTNYKEISDDIEGIAIIDESFIGG